MVAQIFSRKIFDSRKGLLPDIDYKFDGVMAKRFEERPYRHPLIAYCIKLNQFRGHNVGKIPCRTRLVKSKRLFRPQNGFLLDFIKVAPIFSISLRGYRHN